MLDEALLDDPEALTRSDAHGLLRALASAGARVRTAARLADEAGIRELKPDGRPRTVLVAGDGVASHTADLLTALVAGVCPVLPIRPTPRVQKGGGWHWELPGWAGPLDLLLLASPSGTAPGLASLAEQAYQHGCTVVAVAPSRSPLADAAQQARGMALPYATPDTGDLGRPAGGEPVPEDAGTLWALLVPLLALIDRIGVASVPASAVQSTADRLDETAAACGPATATYQNPAKTLAAELDDTLPLLWSEGQGADAAARWFAASLAGRAGCPSLPAPLPEALTAHRGLLTGPFARGDDTSDFFRDRLEEPQTVRLRVVLLRDRRLPQGAASGATPEHRLALEHGLAVSEVSASAAGPLESVAQLLAVTDFASAYLALARLR